MADCKTYHVREGSAEFSGLISSTAFQTSQQLETAREPGTGLNQVCIGVVSTKTVTLSILASSRTVKKLEKKRGTKGSSQLGNAKVISPYSTASPAFAAARRLTGSSVLLTNQANVCAGQSQPIVVGMIQGGRVC